MRISVLSKQHLRVPVAAKALGLPVDLLSLPVQWAFTVDADVDPAEGDWQDGDWEQFTDLAYPFKTITMARVLVGPASDVGLLTLGTVYPWLHIVSAPQDLIFRIPEILDVYGEAA